MPEHVNKPDPDFITITTSVYQKPEVTRAIIVNLEREVMALKNQREYAKNIPQLKVIRIYYQCILDDLIKNLIQYLTFAIVCE